VGKYVAILALSLRLRQRACKVAGQEGNPRVTLHVPGSVKSVTEWTLRLPRQLPLWEMESQWTPEFLKGNFRGQNSLDWRIRYTIGKFLKFRCLKWARMTHLGYLKHKLWLKKKLRVKWRFNSWSLKVRNNVFFSLRVGGMPHIVEKLSMRATTLL
jgi:hypothetical protein